MLSSRLLAGLSYKHILGDWKCMRTSVTCQQNIIISCSARNRHSIFFLYMFRRERDEAAHKRRSNSQRQQQWIKLPYIPIDQEWERESGGGVGWKSDTRHSRRQSVCGLVIEYVSCWSQWLESWDACQGDGAKDELNGEGWRGGRSRGRERERRERRQGPRATMKMKIVFLSIPHNFRHFSHSQYALCGGNILIPKTGEGKETGRRRVTNSAKVMECIDPAAPHK